MDSPDDTMRLSYIDAAAADDWTESELERYYSLASTLHLSFDEFKAPDEILDDDIDLGIVDPKPAPHMLPSDEPFYPSIQSYLPAECRIGGGSSSFTLLGREMERLYGASPTDDEGADTEPSLASDTSTGIGVTPGTPTQASPYSPTTRKSSSQLDLYFEMRQANSYETSRRVSVVPTRGTMQSTGSEHSAASTIQGVPAALTRLRIVDNKRNLFRLSLGLRKLLKGKRRRRRRSSGNATRY